MSIKRALPPPLPFVFPGLTGFDERELRALGAEEVPTDRQLVAVMPVG